jgi:hypothetical protein
MSNPTDIKRTAAIREALDSYERIRTLPPKERQALVAIMAVVWQTGYGAGLDRAAEVIQTPTSKILKAI